MLLGFLRFMRGYVRFTVSGRYPERFINISLRNKLRLWSVTGDGGRLTACMYMRDYLSVRRYARGSGVRLRVTERRGLPTLLRKYSDRTGLVIGAAAFVLTVFVMSLFIWSIDVTGLGRISESEMRAMLRERGVFIGAFRPTADYESACRSIMLADRRVGWMAINVDGSYASVEIKEESPSPKVEDIRIPCNVKARRDGRILRINAEQGKTLLKEGSGVVGGQLVVSGVMEDALGGVRFVRAQAQIIAETDYHAGFQIPKAILTRRPTDEVRTRYSADLFGMTLPLTVGSVSTVEYLESEVEDVPAPLDVRLPAGILTYRLYGVEPSEERLNPRSAEELLTKEAQLYEIFTLSACTVTDRSYRLIPDENGYTLRADFTCTEDIAAPEEFSAGEEP